MGYICRSLLSKLVGTEDVGKIYTVLAFCQSLLPLAGIPFFGFMYRATVRSVNELVLTASLQTCRVVTQSLHRKWNHSHFEVCDNVGLKAKGLVVLAKV